MSGWLSKTLPSVSSPDGKLLLKCHVDNWRENVQSCIMGLYTLSRMLTNKNSSAIPTHSPRTFDMFYHAVLFDFSFDLDFQLQQYTRSTLNYFVITIKCVLRLTFNSLLPSYTDLLLWKKVSRITKGNCSAYIHQVVIIFKRPTASSMMNFSESCSTYTCIAYRSLLSSVDLSVILQITQNKPIPTPKTVQSMSELHAAFNYWYALTFFILNSIDSFPVLVTSRLNLIK